MPDFEPFRALRFAASDLDQLVAPPYDVLSEAEVADLHSRSPHNVSHVDDPRGDDRYAKAGETLRTWLADDVLVADDRPGYTIYRLAFTDAAGARRQISGVLGGLELVDPGAGGVLPHERTTPKASTDRLELTRATQANLSPIWGLSLAAGLTELLAEPGRLLGRVVDGEDADRVEHRVERVDDPARVAAIREAVSAADVLIADGHHRYQISRTYRDELRSRSGGSAGAAEQTLAFVSELVADQLSVAAIHRVYSSPSYPEVREGLAGRFELAPLGPNAELDATTLASMQEDGFLVLIGPDGAERLTPRPGAFDDVRSLDGLWLEQTLADTGADVEVGYQHGLAETVAAVQDGTATAAVLIRPVSVAEIERTARESVLMPPKSTFFTPKLKTGFVIRSLTD